MTTSYHVVALEIPVVYTPEGDHDPNGLIFAPKPHQPLLEWFRDQWEHGNDRLPGLHERRQRAQIVVDDLARLEQQLDRLLHGTDEDCELYAELIRREAVPEYGEAEDRLSHGSRRRSHHAGAVQLHVDATLEELRVNLTALGDLEPPRPEGTPPPPDDEDDPAAPGWEPAEPLLVTLSTGQRTAWRTHWQAQLAMLDEAIAAWFTTFEGDPARSFDADRLRQLVIDETGADICADRISRLLLNDHTRDVTHLGADAPPYNRFNPMKPVPIIEPLVLRTHVGDPLEVKLENQIRGRRVGFHVQGDGIGGEAGAGVRYGDGSHAAGNPDSTCGYGESRRYTFEARHEGVWPVNDLADVRGGQQGSNVHGLFGAVIVEPPGVTWHDPVGGEDLTDKAYGTGMYVDIHQPEALEPLGTEEHLAFVDFHSDDVPRSFREHTVFFHDEPEVHSALHIGEHSIMPLSYRAEPMANRLPHRARRHAEATPAQVPAGQTGVDRRAVEIRLGEDLEEEFWTARTPDGEYVEQIGGEEQHHSSWLFNDPVTPLLRGYKGDPYRIRLVHAGVKETHVFHLHVHQWRAVAQDVAEPGVHGVDEHGDPKPLGSQILDSLTIGPQTGYTIDPLYGTGSRQQAVGDVIWHCHLYPHFHHGMWGLIRSYDRLVDGSRAYPDGQPCPRLEPLPGREPCAPSAEQPGFPWFVDGDFPMKSPPPPALTEDQIGGRRRLLRMAPHTQLEWDAMDPACRDGSQPGSLFVDLDGQAANWNDDAGLPAARIVSYDMEVRAADVVYNADGWHDPRAHHYRILKAEVREMQADGSYATTQSETLDYSPHGNPDLIYPRANHGDIVEWRLHNALTSQEADDFDVAQPPVECGMHVHLVKFDVLSADGSCTGWNYLTGASCREAVGSDVAGEAPRTVGLHRWVVDEEFGPCFFHDHLLANYRQKHGMFSALIAEPHGSLWQKVNDQSQVAWGDAVAAIVPPADSGVPPFRDACLGIGDFVPLLDEGDRPLNPPGELSGDDDPGSMAVNFRSAPLTHRGDDPSLWFSNEARSTESLLGVPGDPDTPVIEAYPGERLRIRLVQGSHEEQHTFSTHGLRWRRDWGNPAAPLVNQQSIGLSEAFTFDIGAETSGVFGPGDHLWKFGSMDDLWTGCWGLVRVNHPTQTNLARLSPLADLGGDPAAALARMRDTRATPPRPPRGKDGAYLPEQVATFVVVARREEHEYAGLHLTDPWGLQLHTAPYAAAQHDEARTSDTWPVDPSTLEEHDGPLVLRARRGQWVRVFLVNELLREDDEFDHSLPRFGPETAPPRLPLEHLDEFGDPDKRLVSPRVSLHPSLLSHDVDAFDGAYVGHNRDGTVALPDLSWLEVGHGGGHEEGSGIVFRDHDGGHHEERNWTEYWWYCDEQLAPASHTDGPGTVCYLQDMADVRNHRHHGLVGALVVEPADVSAYQPGSTATEPDGQTGREAELRLADGTVIAREGVVFFQDGVRLFVNGHPDMPVRDVVPGDDPEDSGQKALSGRTALVHRGRPPTGALADPPLVTAHQGDTVWLRVVGACDKPRQHSLTVHGTAWRAAPWVADGPWTASASGIVADWARTLVLAAEEPGDHVVRTGAFRWGTELGVWGTLRVQG